MNIRFVSIVITGLLALMPHGASALMGQEEAYAKVQSMLGSGGTPADIIYALEKDGRTLSESTVFAMVSGSEENRVDFATSGVMAANSLLEAQVVVDAVLAVAGETGPVADALAIAMDSYIRTMPPPFSRNNNVATKSRGVVAATTPVPPEPPLPPVSPAR